MRAAVQHRVGMLPSLMRWRCELKGLVLAIVVNAGCAMAPVDEAVEYERADALLEAMEQFESLKRACRASGGVMHIEESWGRFTPTLIGLRTAKCASRMQSMPRMRR